MSLWLVCPWPAAQTGLAWMLSSGLGPFPSQGAELAVHPQWAPCVGRGRGRGNCWDKLPAQEDRMGGLAQSR